MTKSKSITPDSAVAFDACGKATSRHPENGDFSDVVERAVSRRGFLGGSFAIGTAAFLSGTSAFAPSRAKADDRFGFEGIPANSLDTVTVPEGYRWQALMKWGEPMWSDAPEFNHTTRGTAASQARSVGDNNDGMALFEVDGRSIFVCNNEYANAKVMFGNRAGGLPET